MYCDVFVYTWEELRHAFKKTIHEALQYVSDTADGFGIDNKQK